MPEPLIALTIFDKLLSVIGLIREDERLAENRKDDALKAILAALKATKAYINDRESGADREKEREFAIAELWQAAAIPLRTIDKAFAERLFIKGGYWMEYDTWTPERVRAKGIHIDQVTRETQKLLTGKPPKRATSRQSKKPGYSKPK